MLKKRGDEIAPKSNPIEAPDYLEADVQALRACFLSGDATKDQQIRAGDFIINQICGTYDFAFRPGETDRETNVALGRQRAGQILVYFLKYAPTKTSADKIAARKAKPGDKDVSND
jgi:hypothetical protein